MERQQLIDFQKLKVNTHNFRHKPVTTEKEAIKLNIDEDIESFKNLIQSLNDDQRTIVFIIYHQDNNLIVMDGNRRLSIYRMIQDNSLIPNDGRYSEIRNMILGSSISQFSNAICDIYYDNETDKSHLMKRLEEIHISDDKTKKEWNGLSQYRASLSMGTSIKYPWMRTVLYYEGEDNDQVIKEYIHSNLDVFNRLIKKQILNIDETGKINHHNDNSIFQTIVEIIKKRKYRDNNDTLHTIDTRTQQSIIDSILREIISNNAQKPSIPTDAENTHIHENQQVDSGSENASTTSANNQLSAPQVETPGVPQPIDLFQNCRTIIPRDYVISSSNHRINVIIDELKKLYVDVCPNACGLLLRVLFELGSKHYLEQLSGSNLEDVHFTKLLKDAREHLYSNGLITDSQKSQLKSDSDTLNKLFNGFAHSTETYPSARELKGYFYTHKRYLIECIR